MNLTRKKRMTILLFYYKSTHLYVDVSMTDLCIIFNSNIALITKKKRTPLVSLSVEI